MMKANLFILSLLLLSGYSLAEEPIKLESSFVGDKEQPAVSYFMPWQGPSSASEVFYEKKEEKYEMSIDAVDRDEMLRSIQIYEEMNLDRKSTRLNSSH